MRVRPAAGPGEVLISADAATAARLPMDGLESRELQLKDRAELVGAWVLRAQAAPTLTVRIQANGGLDAGMRRDPRCVCAAVYAQARRPGRPA